MSTTIIKNNTNLIIHNSLTFFSYFALLLQQKMSCEKIEMQIYCFNPISSSQLFSCCQALERRAPWLWLNPETDLLIFFNNSISHFLSEWRSH